MNAVEGATDAFEAGELYVSPSGKIHWDLPPFDRCFNESTGSGLLAMATASWPSNADTASFFIRSLARNAITRLARACTETKDDAHALEALLIPASQAVEILNKMPPLKGGEYLNAEIIVQWHQALRSHLSEHLAKRNATVSEWLQHLGAPWNRIGRVFFHLAENRDDASGLLPFAFLATFAHKASERGELSHLPLGKAVQVYHDDHKALLSVLQPLKEAAKNSPFLNSLIENQSIYAPMAWNARQARDFLNDTNVFEEAGIIVRMVNLWTTPPKKLQLTVTAEQDKDGTDKGRFSINSILSFSVAASLGGRPLTPDELEALLASDGGLLRFNGEWIDVDSAKIRQLLDRWHQATSMMNRLGIPLVQGLRLLVNGSNSSLPALPPPDGDCKFEAGEKLAGFLKELGGEKSAAPPALNPSLSKILRPYQFDGVAFLERTTSAGFGACLADDMGLGKTLQCLAWLSHLKAEGCLQETPALVIAPASLLGNWEDEIKRFTPELKSTILHPSATGDINLKQSPKNPESRLSAFDVVITSYGMATRLNWLPLVNFSALILDEAQAVKNAGSQRTSAIAELKADRKIALSGTPVENSLNELWSLMNILNPGLLGSRREFDEFVKKLGSDFSPLRKLTHPFILRRMKTDPKLVPDLPDKTNVPAYCPLTPKQAALYKSQIDSLHAILDEPDPAQRLMLILPFLSRFKQICNHPALFLGRGDFNEEESGKFMRLRVLAESIAARQEKLIIFTQFRGMIDPLHSLLSSIYRRPGLVLHGGVPVDERQQLVNSFQREEGPPFFVLSLKAAGTGLTLTQASHVIHFDRWWNPAVENQATDRAYRIGQHKNVLVHRLICKGTIEDRIDQLLRQKQQLADNLFEGSAEKLLMHMNPEEIRELIGLQND